jgi:hypothetical protein
VWLLLAAGCSSTPSGQQTGAAEPTPTTASTAADAPAVTRSAPPRPAPPRPRRGTALAEVGALRVRGRAPLTGYDRARFGDAWLDVDRNGCDTRNDILRRDLTRRTLDAGTAGCVVLGGRLRDPYTAAIVRYARGASVVDIDHVVALGDAWQKGAARWPAARRVALANDPLNLIAVSMGANRAKGDGDTATWLPPNRAFRCTYVALQVAVKHKYRLWVTTAERDAMRRVLAACPRLRSRPRGAIAAVTPGQARTAGAAPTGTGGARVFARCADARAAGVTPIRRGTPLYDANRRLDRDGDGVACE